MTHRGSSPGLKRVPSARNAGLHPRCVSQNWTCVLLPTSPGSVRFVMRRFTSVRLAAETCLCVAEKKKNKNTADCVDSIDESVESGFWINAICWKQGRRKTGVTVRREIWSILKSGLCYQSTSGDCGAHLFKDRAVVISILPANLRFLLSSIKHNRCLLICFRDASSVVVTLQAHFTLWSSPVPVPFWPRLKRSGLSFYRQPQCKPPL